MHHRLRFITAVVLVGGYAALVASGLDHDRKHDAQGPTASFCYKGIMPSICLGCTAHATLLHVDWGPDYFRMSARGIAIPGLQLGYLTNSAGVCNPDEVSEAVDDADEFQG